MSCVLTEYRKPRPRYAAVQDPWRATTPWEFCEGIWRRMWTLRRGMRSQSWRSATIYRSEGAWTWNVRQRYAGGWRIIARHDKKSTYWCARAAMPFADLAARS
jgi:hypothetical protein